MPAFDQRRLTLTVAETAATLGVPVDTVRGWLKRGALASVRIGGRRLVPVEAIDKLLKGTAAGASDAA